MDGVVYVNGGFRPAAEASVSVFDHGLLYGDGVFEGIRAYNGRVFKLERHIDRLFDSAKANRLDIPQYTAKPSPPTARCPGGGVAGGSPTPAGHRASPGVYPPLVAPRGPGDLGIDP